MSDDKIKITYDQYLEQESSDLAYRVIIDGEVYNLPKSRCSIYPKQQAIYVPEWIATEKGLI